MSEKKANSLLERYNKAVSNRDEFKGRWEEAARYMAPGRAGFDYEPGSNKQPYVYDSTAEQAMHQAVNMFMSMVIPPYTRWAELSAGPELAPYILYLQGNVSPSEKDVEKANEEINKDLEHITSQVFNYINGSNLFESLGPWTYDFLIGTGTMLIMPSDPTSGLSRGSPIEFTPIPTYEIAIENGPYDRPTAICRKHKLFWRDRYLEFEDWQDPPNCGHIDKDEKIEVIEATVFNEKKNKWSYSIIFKNQLCLERLYNNNPFVVSHFSLVPGETYGRGPATHALADVKTLNKAKELTLKSAQLNAYGAYTLQRNDVPNVNNVRIFPGAIIPVKQNKGSSTAPTIEPLPTSGNFQWQELQIRELQQQIRSAFMIFDLFPTERTDRMTATEVLARQRQWQMNNSALYGRICNDLIVPLMQRIIDVLSQTGRIALPEWFTKIDYTNLKLDVLSPIARIQNGQDIESLTQAMQLTGQIAPELVNAGFKVEELPYYFNSMLGGRTKFNRPQEEVERRLQDMQQAPQQAPEMPENMVS